jgi:hypothetical protein
LFNRAVNNECIIFFCAGVVYSGEYDVCDVTPECISTPDELRTVAGHVFQARPVWIYTQSNITNNEFYSVRAIFFSVLVLCTQVNMFVMLL